MPTSIAVRHARLPACFLVLGTCLFGLTARAGDAPFGVRADPRPVTIPKDLADPPEPPVGAGTAKSNVFFLNYDGVGIQYTGQEDDATQNISQFSDFAMNYSPYGNGAKRAASMQAVKTDWMPYAVVITDQRPGSGNYTMCVNTPTNPFGGGVLGIAPLDCNDNQARNIVFAYHSDSDEFPASTQATTMSQEIAHAFGLEHVSEPNDIMNPYNAGGDPKFLDQCLALDGGGMGIICGQQHAQYCGGSQQNSHQELLGLFGASAPDPDPPSCAITSPQSGQVFAAGDDFAIAVQANDNVEVKEVLLYDNDNLLSADNSAPYEWPVDGIPAGQHCFSARCEDTSGNQSFAPDVCITAEGAPDPTGDPPPTTQPPTSDPTGDPDPPEDPTTSGDPFTSGQLDEGDEGDDTAGETPVPPGGGPPALPPDYGEEFADCQCRSEGAPVGAAGLLALGLLGLGRRRRR